MIVKNNAYIKYQDVSVQFLTNKKTASDFVFATIY